MYEMKPQTPYKIAILIILILVGGYFGFNYTKTHYLDKGVQIGGIQVVQQQTLDQEIYLFSVQNNQTIPVKLTWEELCNG